MDIALLLYCMLVYCCIGYWLLCVVVGFFGCCCYQVALGLDGDCIANVLDRLALHSSFPPPPRQKATPNKVPPQIPPSSPTLQKQRRTKRPPPKSPSPIRSALSIDRSSSSRFGNVLKISDEGKGECKNTPILARLKRLRNSEGRTKRW